MSLPTNLLQSAVDRGFKCAPDSLFHAMITEIQQDGKPIAWRHESHLQIHPYPNELKYGGYWQDYTSKDSATRDQMAAHYQEEAELCRAIGMTDVKIETKTIQVQIKPKQEKMQI